MDTMFITNSQGISLADRFCELLRDARSFDVLVGYFYSSGFLTLSKALEKTKKIRILVGIGTNSEVVSTIESAKNTLQSESIFSHAEVQEQFEASTVQEMEESEDSAVVEQGVHTFRDWIRSKRIEIRAYPSRNLHAKLYIMTFNEGDRDEGRVITGSSNFTKAGLAENLEFNVELKDRNDYEFAETRFEELWQHAIDVNERYLQTIQTKTWLNQDISPYELFLKFLYEYFKDELNQTNDLFIKFLPEGFKRYQYQEQAVLNAKKIVEEYGGVFLSDVVGLGKTYIAAMLASQLDGRTFVIAPPALLDKNNPGSWTNVFSDFHISADFESVGKLDAALDAIGKRVYRNIIIDEAHRFRTETTIGYEKLAQICRGKRVILVTATPYNNSPLDVLNQIKLFQNARKSTIPNLPNLEQFFNKLNENVKKINRHDNYDEYLTVVKENSKEIREKVLKYLMVRRTRNEIERYFIVDKETQNLRFPSIQDPIPLYYALNNDEDTVFTETIKLITQDFKYARYKPLVYYTGKVSQPEQLSQENMGKFMKVLLVKRLESSFHAFRLSIERFISSYELFIREFNNGNVYISKKYINRIFELLENDDDTAVQELIESGKAECYKSSDFKDTYRSDLQSDLEILKRIRGLWRTVRRDPKLEKLKRELSSNTILKNRKIIIFTESKETAEYLCSNIQDRVICYHGSSGEHERDTIIANFDAKARHQEDDYRILISTEVLSEGVNLHRANVVINYDIPWNPTRMMQRVGRINRVDTPFDTIYTFNFFPTSQAEDEIALKKTAEAKINAFLTLLGGDAALLTEGEPVSSHELFNRLISKEFIMGEDETGDSELRYLSIIKDIRDTNPTLFEKIKHLPKKARSGRKIASDTDDGLLTYFRYGKLQKFFVSTDDNKALELDFITAAKLLECCKNEPALHWNASFYQLLDQNKKAFEQATTEEESIAQQHGGRDSSTQLMKVVKATLRNTQSLTDEQEQYLRLLLSRLEAGSLPRQTMNNTLNALNKLGADIANPLKALAILQHTISPRLLERHYAEDASKALKKREVILSLYLKGGHHD